VHRLFGTSLAITAGDALIFEAYRCLLQLAQTHSADVVERVLGIFTACAASTCRGQALDLGFAGVSATMRQYLRMVRAKTGSMIEAPLVCAALLAGAPALWQQRFRSYGRCLGIAFQIVDDATDYLGSEAQAGKTLGSDLPNGAGSALLIFCREACSPIERDALAQALHRARTLRGDDDAAALLLELAYRHGAVAATQRLCLRYTRRAQQALHGIGIDPGRSELAAIASIVGHWTVPPRPLPHPSQGDRHGTRQAANAKRFVGSHPA